MIVNSGTQDGCVDPVRHMAGKDAASRYRPVKVGLSRRGMLPGGVPPGLLVQRDGAPPGGWLARVPSRPANVRSDGLLASIRADGQIEGPTGRHALVVRYVT